MKIQTLFYLIFIYCSFSCISKPERIASGNSEFEIKLSKFQNDSIKGTKWLTKIYDSINEPDLKLLEFECFRFNFLDSFGKNQLFRIEHINDNYTRMIVKSYDKENNYENEIYSLTSETTIELSTEQYDEFKKEVDGSYFWTLNMIEYPKRMFLDGYSYLLEGYDPNEQRYHIVVRTVPYEGSFKSACDKLMEFYDKEKQNNNQT